MASGLAEWYERENAKREMGLKNEIDINEIKAAGKGVKNKWSEKLKQHPEKFERAVNGYDFDWKEIKNL